MVTSGPIDKTEFAKRLQNTRESLNMTRVEFAKGIGMSPRRYSDLEKKTGTLPNIQTAANIAAYVGISIDTLIFGDPLAAQDNDRRQREFRDKINKRLSTENNFSVYLQMVANFSDERLGMLIDLRMMDYSEFTPLL